MPLVIRRNEVLIRLAFIVLGAVILLSTLVRVYADERGGRPDQNARSGERMQAYEANEKLTIANLMERVGKMEERQIRGEERGLRTSDRLEEVITLLKGIFGAMGALLANKLLDWMKKA